MALRLIEDDFERERDRHERSMQESRAQMHDLIAQGIAAGVGVTSMAKALHMSRGRLNAVSRDLSSRGDSSSASEWEDVLRAEPLVLNAQQSSD
jgi:hypothetical protein